MHVRIYIDDLEIVCIFKKEKENTHTAATKHQPQETPSHGKLTFFI